MAQGDGKVPIDQTVRAGFAFMASSLPVTFPAGVFVAVFAAAAQVLAGPAFAAPGPLALGFVLLVTLASISYTAFLYRLALREDATGFFGLKLGADEGRLIGVVAGLTFVLAVMVLVGVFILALAIAVALTQSGVSPAQLQGDEAATQKALMQILQSPSGGVFWALLAGMLAIVLWVSVRLSLASAATIGEGRMVLFSTFAWTRGNVLNMFIALLPALAPQAGIALLADQISGAGIASVALRFVLAAIQMTLLIPAQAGMYAFLYKGLRPPDFAPRGGAR
jgi:hypothetical protein